MNHTKVHEGMRRAVAAALFCACAGVASAANFRKELLDHHGTTRTYYVSAPKDLAAGEKRPLVLAFHGTGGEGAFLVDNWAKLAQKERFFVAALNALDRNIWAIPGDGPDLVHEMTETLLRKLPIDSSRIYLFGQSAGAVFALRLGLLESQVLRSRCGPRGLLPKLSRLRDGSDGATEAALAHHLRRSRPDLSARLSQVHDRSHAGCGNPS